MVFLSSAREVTLGGALQTSGHHAVGGRVVNENAAEALTDSSVLGATAAAEKPQRPILLRAAGRNGGIFSGDGKAGRAVASL